MLMSFIFCLFSVSGILIAFFLFFKYDIEEFFCKRKDEKEIKRLKIIQRRINKIIFLIEDNKKLSSKLKKKKDKMKIEKEIDILVQEFLNLEKEDIKRHSDSNFYIMDDSEWRRIKRTLLKDRWIKEQNLFL